MGVYFAAGKPFKDKYFFIIIRLCCFKKRKKRWVYPADWVALQQSQTRFYTGSIGTGFQNPG